MLVLPNAIAGMNSWSIMRGTMPRGTLSSPSTETRFQSDRSPRSSSVSSLAPSSAVMSCLGPTYINDASLSAVTVPVAARSVRVLRSTAWTPMPMTSFTSVRPRRPPPCPAQRRFSRPGWWMIRRRHRLWPQPSTVREGRSRLSGEAPWS